MQIGFDANRIFLRMQKIISENFERMSLDYISKLLRLYADMEIQSAKTLFENSADYVLNQLYNENKGVSDEGYTNFLISMVQSPSPLKTKTFLSVLENYLRQSLVD